MLIFFAAALFIESCGSLKNRSSNSNQKDSYHSRFDFIPYGQIVWKESFNTTSAGNFPKNWTTNASAEVVSDKTEQNKSLLLTRDGLYMPLSFGTLPKNFTLEFNLSCSANYSFYSSPFELLFASLSNKKEYTVLKQYNPHTKDVVKLWLHPSNAASNSGYSGYEIWNKGVKQTENEVDAPEFFAHGATATVKVSIWKEKERLRVYLNKDKVWDLPEGFDEGVNYNYLVFSIHHLVDHSGKFFISDIKLSAEGPAKTASVMNSH